MPISVHKKRNRTFHYKRWKAQAQATWDILSKQHNNKYPFEYDIRLGGWEFDDQALGYLRAGGWYEDEK